MVGAIESGQQLLEIAGATRTTMASWCRGKVLALARAILNQDAGQDERRPCPSATSWAS
jgi:hypothetical protein